jgi:transcription antitermination protein NusB
MISRRNIRVKVMQTLYTLEALDHSTKPGEETRILENHLEQTRQLFIYLIWFLTEVARYAEADSRHRASKHLPSAQDLAVNTKISGNSLLWAILELPSFKVAVQKDKPQLTDSNDWIRKIYGRLAETPLYQEYIRVQERSNDSEREIMEFILTDLMFPEEDFVSFLEETFVHWDDDSEMMNLLLLGFLQKPKSYNFQEFLGKEKRQFALDLLDTVLSKEVQLTELITPRLQNWDAERIAVLDMILMKMGTAEFLYFETIPPKVTINEYIDLAKEYSTAQSGQFVNGILDNIHKELVQGDLIHKTSHKI